MDNANSNITRANTLSLMKSHGITPSFLRFQIQNNFHLPSPIVQDHLDSYYLLHWTPAHFQARLIDGIIEHDCHSYQVIYYHCFPAELKNYSNIRVSFRRPKIHAGIENYVLVTTPNGAI